MTTEPSSEKPSLPSPWLDLAIRLALMAGLLAWSFVIVKPFLSPVIWGAVLAVTVYPLFQRTSAALGGRRKITATLFVLVPLFVLSAPLVALTETLVEDVLELNDAYKAGTLAVPEPNPDVGKWPVVGERVLTLWTSAHEDLPGTVEKITPQLLAFREKAVAFARGIATVLVILFFSLLVMAGFLLTADGSERTVRGLSVRIAGANGDALVALARDTTRSVAKGIVGVASIQALLAGVGCLVAGVPGAGVWAVLVLILAIAQLPTLIVLGPLAIYVFSRESVGVALAFTIWCVIVGLLDNVLKPILMGKGVEAPMLVVFLGAIGGMVASGPMGLFVGPVVLVVTFTLIQSWANLSPKRKSSGPGELPTPDAMQSSATVAEPSTGEEGNEG